VSMRLQDVLAGGLIAAIAAGSASAGTVPVQFTIQTNTFDNFQFSVFHSSDAAGGQGGTILEGFTGTFTVVFDDVAQTIAFTEFDGSLNGGGQVTLADASSLSFAGQESGSGDQLVSGDLSLNIINPNSGGSGQVDFTFDAQAFNSLANQFFFPDGTAIPAGAPESGEPFGLGLWGQGVFQGDPGTGPYSDGVLGIDLFASGQIIPLPTPVALGAAGLIGLAAGRRRMSV